MNTNKCPFCKHGTIEEVIYYEKKCSFCNSSVEIKLLQEENTGVKKQNNKFEKIKRQIIKKCLKKETQNKDA